MYSKHRRKIATLWKRSTPLQRRAFARTWIGHAAHSWWSARLGRETPCWIDGLPRVPQNRSQLASYLKRETEKRRAIAAVLAWGGMRPANAFNSADEFDRCLALVRSFRGTRRNCYRKFRRAQIQGLGPAFGTKLIRYLRPKASDHGFIMDQWLAKSVNLVDSRAKIRMDGEYVSPRNTERDYVRFCKCIEALAEELEASAIELEEFMFASPKWRAYVERAHRC